MSRKVYRMHTLRRSQEKSWTCSVSRTPHTRNTPRRGTVSLCTPVASPNFAGSVTVSLPRRSSGRRCIFCVRRCRASSTPWSSGPIPTSLRRGGKRTRFTKGSMPSSLMSQTRLVVIHGQTLEWLGNPQQLHSEVSAVSDEFKDYLEEQILEFIGELARGSKARHDVDTAEENRSSAWEEAAAAEGQRWLDVSTWIQNRLMGTVTNSVVAVAMEYVSQHFIQLPTTNLSGSAISRMVSQKWPPPDTVPSAGRLERQDLMEYAHRAGTPVGPSRRRGLSCV